MLIILSVFLAAPFVLLIISSFTEESTAVKYGYTFFPKMLSLDAYRYIFSNIGMFGKAFLITICVTVTGVIVSLLISSMMAYVLSRKGIPGGRILNFFVVFTMLFNGGLVATYLNYVQVFHIKNTYLALLIPNLLCNAFSIMMIKNYFQSSIPEELLEAARIDGASEMKIFLKIVIPLSKPILATVALIVGLAYWNDWQNALLFMDSDNKKPLQLLLINIQSSIETLLSNRNIPSAALAAMQGRVPQYSATMATVVVVILPVMIAYPFFQKYFIKGLTIGSVKY